MRPAPDVPRFGVGVVMLAWLGAFVFSQIGYAIVLGATGYTGTDADGFPLWVIAVLQIPLWIGMIGAVLAVDRHWGTGSLKRDLGFRFQTVDVLGIPIGVAMQIIFVPALYWVLRPVIDTSKVDDAAQSLTDRATGWGVVLLILVVVVGAPLVEELFFRGLLMRSFQARYNDALALVASAVLFGLVHLQLLQLPALILFGLVAGYLAQRTGRLGMSVFAHAGFNGATVVMLLAAR